MKHSEAIKLAADWLKRPASRKGPGCQIVVTEAKIAYNNGEIPDAIGFRAGTHNDASVLVECKVSRADFMVDAKKPHRAQSAQGMGLYRYYLAPAGIIKIEELPAGWGLLEVSARGVIKPVHGHVKLLRGDDGASFRHERNIQNEWALLARTLYRVGDPDAINRRLRDAHNGNQRLLKTLEKERQQTKRLDAAFYHLYSNATEEEQLKASMLRTGRTLTTALPNFV